MLPANLSIIHTLDSHTAGEGTRLVTHGFPPLHGETMAEKMADAQARFPAAPGALLLEPRGHKDLYGALLTGPCHPGADFGVVFMNNRGYEPMCGHGLIGVVTCLLETGLLPAAEPETRLAADTPAGLIRIHAAVRDGRVLRVRFVNVPSFALALDVPLSLANGRRLTGDIAFGGNFFLLIDSRSLEIELSTGNAHALAELGMQALKAANEQVTVVHPQMKYLDRITDVRFYEAPFRRVTASRNVVVLGESMVDRSPCGTGTCAELAVRYARRLIQTGETLVSEGILGTRFSATVVEEVHREPVSYPYPVIIPRLEGQAFLTGAHRFVFREDDPFRDGFLIAA